MENLSYVIPPEYATNQLITWKYRADGAEELNCFKKINYNELILKKNFDN